MSASPSPIDEFYELEESIDFIKHHHAKIVALQFPDYLLKDSTYIATILTKNTEAKIYILADTSYSSCCVDEVAAQHANVDAIIHYGESCHSYLGRLPVKYIYGKLKYDIVHMATNIVSKFYSLNSKNVLLFCDSTYFWSISLLHDAINNLNPNFNIYFPINDSNNKSDSKSFVTIAGHSFLLNNISQSSLELLKSNLAGYSVFFLGSADTTLFAMIYLNLSYLNIKVCNPKLNSEDLRIVDTENVIFRGTPAHRVISRRYYLVEEVKKAQIIGIICGTLSTTKYLDLVSYCKKLIENNGKKCVILSIGKINIPKVCNFPEIEAFVNLSCPLSALIEDEKNYPTIVTPWELTLAFSNEWKDTIIVDFDQVLSNKCDIPEIEAVESTNSSLIVLEDRQVMIPDNLVSSKLVEKMNARTFKGLEVNKGSDPVLLQQGLSGIARHYE